MASTFMPNDDGATAQSPQDQPDQPAYEGGPFHDIRSLATALGGDYKRDSVNGKITVNGQPIQWVTAVGGQYNGSVHDVADAIPGARVEPGQNGRGSYQAFAPKAAPTSQGSTSVTGNPQMQPATQTDQPPQMPQPGDALRRLIGGGIPANPGIPVQPPAQMPQPGDALRRLIGVPGIPAAPGTPGRPPNSLDAQPGQMQIMGAPDSPVTGNPTIPMPGDPLRRVAPGYGGQSPTPGMSGHPPITSPVEPPRMSAMAAPGATDQQSPITPLPGAQPGGPVITPGIGTQPVGPAPQMTALSTGAQAAPAPTSAPYQAPPGQTPAAQALGQRLMQGVPVPQQIADPPSSATPPGWHFTPQVTPAAVDLGQRTMGDKNQVGVPAPAPGPANQPPPAAQPDGPQQFKMPDFNYQQQPIDYNALQQRAALEAQMWANPYLQQLRDAAALAQQRNLNERGYVNQGLQDDISQLRAGEPAREQRINNLMNNRGDALYGSGVHLGAIRDQQVADIQQEGRLTVKAQNALTKLADNLGLTLQDITSKTNMLTQQQGDKAFLTLQQLADKATTQQFENRKLAWQMWLGGAQLTQKDQQMANQLWLGNQQIKSADARAAADRSLKLAISNNTLQLEWSKFYQQDPNGKPGFEAQKWAQTQVDESLKAAGYARMPDGSLVRSLDGKKFDLSAADYMSKQTGYIIGMDGKPLLDDQGQPVRNLEGAKFDWTKQQFIISEGNKVAYQNAIIGLRQQGLITQQQHNSAMEDIQRGHLSIQDAQRIETNRHNKATETNTANQETETNRHNLATEAKGPGGNPYTVTNSAWKGAMSDLSFLDDSVKTAGMTPQQLYDRVQALVGKWLPQLSPADQENLKAYVRTKIGK